MIKCIGSLNVYFIPHGLCKQTGRCISLQLKVVMQMRAYQYSEIWHCDN